MDATGCCGHCTIRFTDTVAGFWCQDCHQKLCTQCNDEKHSHASIHGTHTRKPLCCNCYGIADQACIECSCKFFCSECFPTLHKSNDKKGHSSTRLEQQNQALNETLNETQTVAAARGDTACEGEEGIGSAAHSTVVHVNTAVHGPHGHLLQRKDAQYHHHQQQDATPASLACAAAPRCGMPRCASNGELEAEYYCQECSQLMCMPCNTAIHVNGRNDHTRVLLKEQQMAFNEHSSSLHSIAAGTVVALPNEGAVEWHINVSTKRAISPPSTFGHIHELAISPERTAVDTAACVSRVSTWTSNGVGKVLRLESCLQDPWLATEDEYISIIKHWVCMCKEGTVPQPCEEEQLRALLNELVARKRLDVVLSMLRKFRWVLIKEKGQTEADTWLQWATSKYMYRTC